MKRKLLSIVLALTMALGMLPAAALAEGEGGTSTKGVAKVGETEYPTLQAAIDKAAKNATVTLLADTRENVTISTPYVTLDLNGHTLNGSTGERKPALTITARVTVKDSSEGQTGTIMREDTAANSGVSSHYVIDVQGSGWLTFESGTVKNGSGAGGTKGASLVRVGDDSVAKYPGLNIKGGTFTQDNFIVIKVDRGDLFLNGGTLNSANSYAVENWLRATIKGGTVNGNVSSWTYSKGSNSTLTISGGTVNGDVESVSYDGAEGKLAKVEITGGTVNGTLSTKIYGEETAPGKDMATIEITGGTFSRDPSAYLVEGSTATPNSNGTYGVAKAYLAKVGETSYYTMDEAFKAQTKSGEAIVLLRDYTTGSTFNSGTVARVVDLRGHTWTCTGTDANSAAFEINNPNASLTVKNGKIVSSQLVGLIPSASGGTIKYDNSSLTFENVGMSTTATSGIETNGNNTNDTVTLINSTLNVPNGFGIYFPSSGKLTIDNSTINAKTMGVQVCAGSLSINAGSTITVSGDAVPKAEGDGAIQDGAAISIVNRTGYKGLDKIEVTGGTFTAKDANAAIKAYDWQDKTGSDFTASGKVSVSGGTFSSEVPENCCAPGFEPTQNNDGTHGVKTKANMAAEVLDAQGKTVGAYNTLTDAIAAAKDGETVTLLKDAETTVELSFTNKAITLDLNGKTVSGTFTDNFSVIEAGEDASLTVQDTSVAGTGKIASDKYGISARDGGALIVKSGTIASEYAPLSGNNTAGNMNFTVNGGTLTAKSGPAIYMPGQVSLTITDGVLNGGISLRMGQVNISGGTINAITTGIDMPTDNLSGKPAYAYSGNVWFPDALYVIGGTYTSTDATYGNSLKMNITGGTFNCTNGKGSAVAIYDLGKVAQTANVTISGDAKFETNSAERNAYQVVSFADMNATPITGYGNTEMVGKVASAISGGTFSSEVKPEYCADGYIPKDNGDGTYGVTRPSSSSSSSRYDITVDKASHGTVSANSSRAFKGDTVTVTVKPDSGYVLETITVTDKDGNELTLTDKGDGKYTFTMPRGAVTVKATFMEDNTVLNFFYDVPNDAYYYEAVKWAVEKGITSGIGNDLFGSNDPCTRAQIVTFLWRAAGSPEPKALSSFTDVPADAWYAKAVAWAVENGVTAGVGDGLFGSDDTCTRAQSVTFLFKALKAAAKGQADFKDVSASDWYAKAVAWAVENGVTAGVGGGLFGSGDDCTRAQIVTFLFKAYQGK